MTHKEFIKQIKETVKKQAIPPHYNPYEWELKRFNCYAYALRICMSFSQRFYLIAPGFIRRGEKNDYNFTKERTLDYFKDDCEALGLQVFPTKLEEQIGEKEYKIAVYLDEGRDFHFARQDSNGEWSHKDGWFKKIESIDKEDITKNSDGYKFIGIFRVSKK